VVLRGERVSNDPDLLDNLQVWVENNYDIRFLHSNLAIPLLKKLVDLGDPTAKNEFKEVIAKRILNGNINSSIYYISQNYLCYFEPEELKVIIDRINDIYILNNMKESVWKEINLNYLKKSIKKINSPSIEKVLLNKAVYMLRNGNEEDLIKILIHRGFIRYLSKENYEILLTNTPIQFLNYIAKIMSLPRSPLVTDNYGTSFSEMHLIKEYLQELKKISIPNLKKWLLFILPNFNQLGFEIRRYLLKEGYLNILNYDEVMNLLDNKSSFLNQYFAVYKKRIYFVKCNGPIWKNKSIKPIFGLNLSNKNIIDINEILGLENLPYLKELNLSNNKISKIKGLENLIELEVLDLSHNNITKIESIYHLTKLRVLYLSNNSITAIEGLENLENIQRVDLDNNNISVLKLPFNFKRNGYLQLSGNKITGLKQIEQIGNITHLYLDNNQISETTLSKKLNDLLVLSLKNNNTHKIKSLDKLPKLETLYLDKKNTKIRKIKKTSSN